MVTKMSQKSKYENELARAMKEAELRKHMIQEYEARKQLLVMELREINAQLEKLKCQGN